MEISHTRARRLIQFDADQSLGHPDKEILQVHLKSCAECRQYEAGIKEVESVIVPLMRRQWNLSPAPLSPVSLQGGKSKILTGSYLLATRTAIVGLICMVFLFSIWQFTFATSPGMPRPFTAAVPQIPTPSIQLTFTNTAQSCTKQSHLVTGNDTLEGIAHQFAISKDEIRSANQLKSEVLRPGTILWIPVCTFTPTGTVNASTTTFTPSLRPITSTPGG